METSSSIALGESSGKIICTSFVLLSVGMILSHRNASSGDAPVIPSPGRCPQSAPGEANNNKESYPRLC